MLRLNGRMRAMTDDWRGGENYIECFFVVAEEEEGEGQREEEDEWSGVEWSAVEMGFIWEGMANEKVGS